MAMTKRSPRCTPAWIWKNTSDAGRKVSQDPDLGQCTHPASVAGFRWLSRRARGKPDRVLPAHDRCSDPHLRVSHSARYAIEKDLRPEFAYQVPADARSLCVFLRFDPSHHVQHF